MAVARLSVKVGERGKAAPHAAYIAREGKYVSRLEHEVLEAVEHGNMPAWAQHAPEYFWMAADQFERKNGTVYREFEVSLPRELTPAQRLALVRDLVSQELGNRHAYQWAIHNSRAQDGGEQPHLHLMFSERLNDGIPRDPDRYFKRYNPHHPEKGGARKQYEEVDPTLAVGEARAAARVSILLALRARWERLCNDHLALAHQSARIDMRSYKARGIDRVPEPKQSPGGWRNGGSAMILVFRRKRSSLERLRRATPGLLQRAAAEVVSLEQARQARAQRTEQEARRLSELPPSKLREAITALADRLMDEDTDKAPDVCSLQGKLRRCQSAMDAWRHDLTRQENALQQWRKDHPLRAFAHAKLQWSTPALSALKAAARHARSQLDAQVALEADLQQQLRCARDLARQAYDAQRADRERLAQLHDRLSAIADREASARGLIQGFEQLAQNLVSGRPAWQPGGQCHDALQEASFSGMRAIVDHLGRLPVQERQGGQDALVDQLVMSEETLRGLRQQAREFYQYLKHLAGPEQGP